MLNFIEVLQKIVNLVPLSLEGKHFAMKKTLQIIALILLTLGSSLVVAQTYNDGPTQLRVKVRQIYVSRAQGADVNLNLGSGGIE